MSCCTVPYQNRYGTVPVRLSARIIRTVLPPQTQKAPHDCLLKAGHAELLFSREGLIPGPDTKRNIYEQCQCALPMDDH